MRLLAHLLAGVGILLTSGVVSLHAQTGLEGGHARPAIPPGKVGAAGHEGPTPRATAATEATIAEIMDDPRLYVGRNVTVASRVEKIFTPWAFKLDEQQPLAGGTDNDMLVIGAVPLKAWGFDKSWETRQVRVTGTVRLLQAADFRREYGRGADDAMFRRYEGKPVLVATKVEKAG